MNGATAVVVVMVDAELPLFEIAETVQAAAQRSPGRQNFGVTQISVGLLLTMAW